MESESIADMNRSFTIAWGSLVLTALGEPLPPKDAVAAMVPAVASGRNFSILLRMAGTGLTTFSPKVEKLLGPEPGDIVNVDPDGLVFRIWVFDEWGDSFYQLKYHGGDPDRRIQALKTSSKTGYELAKSADGKLGDQEILGVLGKVMENPLPLPDPKEAITSGDRTSVLVEGASAKQHKWAIRSRQMVSDESFNEICKLLHSLEALKWEPE